MTPSPEQVAACFSRCTGIRLRYLSHNQHHLCAEFVKHFTLEELEIVIIYVQKQIQIGKLDERSLAFRNIMGEYGGGNEFASFQDRLAMASKQVRLKPEPKPVTRHVRVDEGKIVSMLDVAPEPDTPDMREETARQLGELKRSMNL